MCDGLSSDYLDMVDEIAKFDLDAAEYLWFHAPYEDHFTDKGDLVQCIIWPDTPQGLRYWLYVHDELHRRHRPPWELEI